MIIHFSSQRRDDVLYLSRAGDVLTINSETFDFTSLPDGATIPADAIPCDWIAGPVERIDGVLRVVLLLPHGPSPSAAVAFPAPITVAGDGPIAVPLDEDPVDVDA